MRDYAPYLSAGRNLCSCFTSLFLCLAIHGETHAQSALSADFTGDGIITENDLLHLLRGMGKARSEQGYTIPIDLDVSGEIDHRDVLLFMNAWYGTPSPRQPIDGDTLRDRIGTPKLVGEGIQLRCAPGAPALPICVAGIHVYSETATEVGGVPALPVNLVDEASGGASLKAYMTMQGDISLLQADIAGPILGPPTGPVRIPPQSIPFSEPMVFAQATIVSGSPYIQTASMTLQYELVASSKLIAASEVIIGLETESTWLDCSPGADWSYSCLLQTIMFRLGIGAAQVRLAMLFSDRGAETVQAEVVSMAGTTPVTFELVPADLADFGDLIAVFENPTPGANDSFGWSIGRMGNNVLVGCPFDDDDTFPNGGASYLFDGLTGDLLTTLSNPGSDDLSFGEAQTGIGGFIVVGSLSETDTVNSEGFAYVFDASPTRPTYGESLLDVKNPHPTTGGFFGAEIEADRNLLAISAYNNVVNNIKGGRVYLYNFDTSAFPPSLVSATILDNPEPSATDQFGDVVRFLGNGLIGVSGRFDDYDTFDGAGSVYIFDSNPASPDFGKLLKTLRSPSPFDFEAYGYDFARPGNVIAIGVPYAHKATPQTVPQGSVFLYDGDPASPQFGSFLLELRNPSEGLFSELYGGSMASFGSILAVGAQQFVEDGQNSGGAVHFYDCDQNSSSFGQLIKTIKNPSLGSPDGFGGGVINVNGDIVVAAMNYPQTVGQQTFNSSGIVYRFQGP